MIGAGAAEPRAVDVSCEFIGGFGVVTETVASASDGLSMVAVVSDFSLMGKCLSNGCASIDGSIHAAGNILSFKCNGAKVRVTVIPAHTGVGSMIKPTTFQVWAHAINTGGLIEGGDLDGDGVSNLMEYALGLDPATADGTATTQAIATKVDGEEYLALTYHRDLAASDVVVVVQRSSDLSLDGWTTEGIETESVAVEGRIETRVAKVRMGSERQFLRLVVSRIPGS